jgi:hypothetical protein
MNKKAGLIQRALESVSGKPPPSIKMRDGAGYPIPAARRGKKAIMGWFDPAVGEQLREISYEERVSQQALLREALNLMFKKHGKAEIA